MNKLVLRPTGRNHIKICPLKDAIEIPEDGAEKIKLCERIYSELQHSDKVVRHYYERHTQKGYQVSVWELDSLVYLVQCIRDMEGNYIVTIYIGRELQDMIGIAKFLKQNIETIGKEYKEQVIEGKEEWDKLQRPDSPTA